MSVQSKGEIGAGPLVNAEPGEPAGAASTVASATWCGADLAQARCRRCRDGGELRVGKVDGKLQSGGADYWSRPTQAS